MTDRRLILLALSALALLGPGSSRPATAQARSLAVLSLLAPPAVVTSYTVTDLGALGGTNSIAYGLSDAGEVCGVSDVAGDSSQHGFTWVNGKMQDLGTLTGNFSFANNSNAAGQVVGAATTANDTGQHAVLWTNGK